MQTAILTIKPIDDHGTIDDEKAHELEVTWDEDDTVTNIGCFVVEKIDQLCEETISEDEDESRYAESLPAFDLTITLHVKEDKRPEPQEFIIEENTTYTVVARDADEAERIWLEKGEKAAEFTGVQDRDIYPNPNPR